MKRSLLLLAAFVLCSISSCTIDVTPSAYINITSTGFDNDGGCYYVVLAANSSWESSCDDDDVTVDPSSGYGSMPVKITVPANPERTTYNIRITFTVTGQGADSTSTKTAKTVATVDASPFIDVTSSEIELPAEGGGARFTVQSNYGWVFDGNTPQWVNVTPQSATYNSIVSVEAPANNTGTERTYTLKFTVEAYPSISADVKVVQKPI